MPEIVESIWPIVAAIIIAFVGGLLASSVKGSPKKIVAICAVLVLVLFLVHQLRQTIVPIEGTSTQAPESLPSVATVQVASPTPVWVWVVIGIATMILLALIILIVRTRRVA